ncbi:YndM family protein [Virgibacillus alimentarius]|uniref:DUF2512 family protein n=1 Tax=Virgibacillus alimentarius TaxID=698769 RepID=A0ABS4SA15_9BACI|nr:MULTISPECIES: YndM family protein [Virgibacillus]MBP2257719.1 hypothetical protein [Virgibacillus alimentarius]HLR69287.1 YndM family protein [Virgibacillus sp.]
MKYIAVLFMKFVLATGVLWLVLGGLEGVSFASILIISIVLTAISFIVGDLYLLPKMGNIGATMADAVLALAVVWSMGALLFTQPIGLDTVSLVSAVGIALGELLVHWYVKKQFISDESTIQGLYDHDLQTEYGEEIKPDTTSVENKRLKK